MNTYNPKLLTQKEECEIIIGCHNCHNGDIVEVVRCKDCVYFCPNNFRKCKLLWEHRNEDDYYSRGERRKTE